MRRERLRGAHGPEILASLYKTPHSHGDNSDHRLRVAVTVALARTLFGAVQTAADLACGDGAILGSLKAGKSYYGDVATGWPIAGPVEATIGDIPHVDLFVCTETIEHLDDPDTTVKAIRDKADALLLSTPVEAWNDRINIEHYWAWDREAVDDMLRQAKFRTIVYNELDLTAAGPDHYRFGIWCAR